MYSLIKLLHHAVTDIVASLWTLTQISLSSAGSYCRVLRTWTPASVSSTLVCLWSEANPLMSFPDFSRWTWIWFKLHNRQCFKHFVWILNILWFTPFFQEWKITRLSYEYDSEPFGKERDAAIKKLASEAGVEVTVRISHTLYELDK